MKKQNSSTIRQLSSYSLKQLLDNRRSFVLKVVQPSLEGLMDGSVSTLAPIFAAVFATQKPHVGFVVGLSAAVGAGISMAFAEALSDTGVETGRGHPIFRGAIVGLMTFLGGILHTLPFLISNVNTALYLAYGVVVFELIVISYIRYRFFQLNFIKSAFQVIVGGVLVFLSGVVIGNG
ncbi:hypothetical protein [Scytonema sp. PRP1]|uniref:hypothetical protein n=1 Tax=Scytonema sp. PRP1 TaxID=3120513 RepID=UPI002FD1DDA7